MGEGAALSTRLSPDAATTPEIQAMHAKSIPRERRMVDNGGRELEKWKG